MGRFSFSVLFPTRVNSSKNFILYLDIHTVLFKSESSATTILPKFVC